MFAATHLRLVKERQTHGIFIAQIIIRYALSNHTFPTKAKVWRKRYVVNDTIFIFYNKYSSLTPNSSLYLYLPYPNPVEKIFHADRHEKAMTDFNVVQVLYQKCEINHEVQRLRASRNCIITDKLGIETS